MLYFLIESQFQLIFFPKLFREIVVGKYPLYKQGSWGVLLANLFQILFSLGENFAQYSPLTQSLRLSATLAAQGAAYNISTFYQLGNNSLTFCLIEIVFKDFLAKVPILGNK